MVDRTDGPERFLTATFSDQTASRSIRIPEYASLSNVNPMYVAIMLTKSSGSLQAGMYVNRGFSVSCSKWRRKTTPPRVGTSEQYRRANLLCRRSSWTYGRVERHTDYCANG